MQHPELPIAAFISAFLVLIPLPWHWRAGNIPTVSIIIWLFVVNMVYGIDSIIWAGNVNVVIPVWCDIVTKIMMGSNIALPVALCRLAMHLERISSVRAATPRSTKTRQRVIDGLFCWGIPAVYMALHYVVQGHRFDIVEDFGCRPTTYVSIASIFIIWVPPLFFSLATAAYSAAAFAHFWSRRVLFAQHLADTNSALSASRYTRLMAMAVVEMFVGLFITAFNMWFTMRDGLRPWISWENVHQGFWQIGLFPLIFIDKRDLAYTFFLWWTIPISTLIFFAFFGFGQDAMREYRECYSWVRRKVFRVPDPVKSLSSSILPSFRIRQQPSTISISISKTSEFHCAPTASSYEKTTASPTFSEAPFDPTSLYNLHLDKPLDSTQSFPSVSSSPGSSDETVAELRRAPSIKSHCSG